MRFFSRPAEVLVVVRRNEARAARRRVRLPRLRASGRPYQWPHYRKRARKLAFLEDPVSMTLLPWAWPKHFGR